MPMAVQNSNLVKHEVSSNLQPAKSTPIEPAETAETIIKSAPPSAPASIEPAHSAINSIKCAEPVLECADTAQPIRNGDEHDSEKPAFPGVNLYVKNLDDSFTDAKLHRVFQAYGAVTSAKVMCDDSGRSRGFGFVCFETEENAEMALKMLAGRIVGTKPLYVARALKKADRKKQIKESMENMRKSPIHQGSFFNPGGPCRSETLPTSYTPPVSYTLTSSVFNPYVQFKYIPNEVLWRSNMPVSYVMPPNQPITYLPTSHQPLVILPNYNTLPRAPMPSPQPVPILHQPIYLHSSKNSTLIYSTGAHASTPQMPAYNMPMYPMIPSNLGQNAVNVQSAPAENTSPRSTEIASDKVVSHPQATGCSDAALAAVDTETSRSSSDVQHHYYRNQYA